MENECTVCDEVGCLGVEACPNCGENTHHDVTIRDHGMCHDCHTAWQGSSARECNECGTTMTSGFVADCVPYCSEECLLKHFTLEEWSFLYEEEPDLYYWTDWVA